MPSQTAATTPLTSSALSRSCQYRKVMKPLLERRRRARINKCLDELKQLIVDTVRLDAETLAKLEKADILELTVHHLHRQRSAGRSSNPLRRDRGDRDLQRYWSGFQQCALEVSRFLQLHDKQLSGRFLDALQRQSQRLRSGVAVGAGVERVFWRPW